jgi:hypothetical protein
MKLVLFLLYPSPTLSPNPYPHSGKRSKDSFWRIQSKQPERMEIPHQKTFHFGNLIETFLIPA